MNEQIKERLTSLIYNHVVRGKKINEHFINEIIEIIVNENDLNDYFKGVKINNKPWNGRKKIKAAEYDFFSRIIFINLQAMLEFYQDNIVKLGLNSKVAAYYLATETVDTIMHELEHAYQVKKYDSKKETLENLVIEGSFDHISPFRDENYIDELLDSGYSEEEIKRMLNKIDYSQNTLYEINPLERLANYYSVKAKAEIIRELNIPELSYHSCLELCRIYLAGYKEGIIPTEYFLGKIDALNRWPEIESLSRNSGLETRLSLGLRLREDEYTYLKNTTTELISPKR